LNENARVRFARDNVVTDRSTMHQTAIRPGSKAGAWVLVGMAAIAM
jgi:hypothetical protein